MNTIKLTEVTGRPVVAADDATEIGTIKHVVLSPEATHVDAVHIGGRRSRADLVDWSEIESIGPDAVMVTSGDDTHRPESDEDDEFVREKVEIIGARVLDTDGYQLGELTDLEFDVDTGDVVAAITETERFDAERFRSIGRYALVVTA